MARSQPGFTLLEVVVWVAVLTILAVSLTPPLVAGLDRARRDAGLDALQDIETGVTTFEGDIGKYPPGLGQLLEPLVNGDADICGDNYNGGQRNGWDGPYFHHPLPATGWVISLGTVQPDFLFFDLGTSALMVVAVDDVDEADALGLDASVDDSDGSNAGTIRWTVAGDGLVTLGYVIPIPSC